MPLLFHVMEITRNVSVAYLMLIFTWNIYTYLYKNLKLMKINEPRNLSLNVSFYITDSTASLTKNLTINCKFSTCLK